MIPKFAGGSKIICKNDFTYMNDVTNEKLIRIRTGSYMRNNKMLTVLSTENYQDFIPFGCGYNIRHNIISDEEMALALLSLDETFDICCMNSRQEISANIREKGSFYPLNDVKNVKEYLDRCFPYIKDIATNSDGDIWMLPIYTDIPCIIYNPEICRQYGIEPDSSQVDSFFALLADISRNTSLKDLYYYRSKTITDYCFYQYFSSFDHLSTDTFRAFAQMCRARLNYSREFNSGNIMLPINYSFSNDSNFLFMLIEDSGYQSRYAGSDILRALSLPDITNSGKNAASCYYLTVNPASKNLKSALQYISSLCKYLMSMNDYIMNRDRSIYPDSRLMDDLYDIYSKGNICFTYPNELFMDDFEKYLSGEKDLDSFIADSDRRLDTFMNE